MQVQSSSAFNGSATTVNVTIWSVANNEFGNSPGYSLGYNYINQALFTFLPLGILVVFNSLLVRSVMRAASTRKSMTVVSSATSRKSHVTSSSFPHDPIGYQAANHGAAAGSSAGGAGIDHRITLMLIVVSVVFLVCQVLPDRLLLSF